VWRHGQRVVQDPSALEVIGWFAVQKQNQCRRMDPYHAMIFAPFFEHDRGDLPIVFGWKFLSL
jgi:hypothetical protein